MFYSIRYKYLYSESVLNFLYVYDKVKQTNKVLRGKKNLPYIPRAASISAFEYLDKTHTTSKKGYI